VSRKKDERPGVGPAAQESTGSSTSDESVAHENVDVSLPDAIVAFIRRYVVLTDEQADAIALWVIHTHSYDALGITPYLAITSPEKRSGKTLLLEILELLVREPWLSGSVTGATLARMIDANAPTLLLDESDVAFSSSGDYAEALRGVLNTGFRASGKYTRCVGDNHKVTTFSTFSPKAIAGLRTLPDTIADRSISIRLQRKTASEPVERFRRRKVEPTAALLKERIEHWVEGNQDPLAIAYVDELPELSDRANDIWEPLFGIARFVGGDWPERARRAALVLSGPQDAHDDSIGVQLLSDIREVFAQKGDRISSAELKTALIAIEDSPWGDWKAGKPITSQGLSKLLRRYGIKTMSVWIPDGGKVVGYKVEQFGDAFERYLHPPSLDTRDGRHGRDGRSGFGRHTAPTAPTAPTARLRSGQAVVGADDGKPALPLWLSEISTEELSSILARYFQDRPDLYERRYDLLTQQEMRELAALRLQLEAG
jgi:hypothetical protein